MLAAATESDLLILLLIGGILFVLGGAYLVFNSRVVEGVILAVLGLVLIFLYL